MTTSKVIFIPVRENAAKFQAIAATAHHYFTAGARLLFCVPSDEAARYLDELLWKLPPESFLPHSIITAPSNEAIAITTSLDNLNGASIVFNLRPEVNPLASKVSVTYEFMDGTHPSKLELSQKKETFYRDLGLMGTR